MEHEKSVEQPTVKKLLGSKGDIGNDQGLINEYESFIHRHAYDYLMVGFATDVDQTEEQHEARYTSYVDRIEADFAQYRDDVQRWNHDHLINTDPELWQTQKDRDTGQLIRRTDLPSEDVCAGAIISNPAIYVAPTREDLSFVAQEGIDKYFNQALRDAYELLQARLEAIAEDMPTAPLVLDGNYPKTFSELVAERNQLDARMEVLKLRIKNMPAELRSARIESTKSDSSISDELLTDHTEVRAEYSKVKQRLDRIVMELPLARLDDIKTKDDLIGEYASVVSRMNALEELRDQRQAQTNQFVPSIEERHTLMDELRPVTAKMAIVGQKVLQITGIKL